MKVTQLCPTLCDPMDYTGYEILQPRILEWVAFPLSRGSSQPRDQAQVSHIAGRYLPAEPQRKPKNTEVGSLSLLQWIFPAHESNPDILRCRQIFTSWASRETHTVINRWRNSSCRNLSLGTLASMQNSWCIKLLRVALFEMPKYWKQSKYSLWELVEQ